MFEPATTTLGDQTVQHGIERTMFDTVINNFIQYNVLVHSCLHGLYQKFITLQTLQECFF